MENVKSNKIKLTILGIVAAICLAGVAGLATLTAHSVDAADSPVADITFDKVSVSVSGIQPSTAKVAVAQAGNAGNVPAGADVVASIEVNQTDGGPRVTSATITIAAKDAASAAGKDCIIYVQHSDGTYEQLSGKFNNSGVCSFTVNKLSIFTAVADLPESGSGGKSTDGKSPKTGLEF